MAQYAHTPWGCSEFCEADSFIAALLADDDDPEHSPIVKEFTDFLHDINVTKTKEISVWFSGNKDYHYLDAFPFFVLLCTFVLLNYFSPFWDPKLYRILKYRN